MQFALDVSLEDCIWTLSAPYRARIPGSGLFGGLLYVILEFRQYGVRMVGGAFTGNSERGAPKRILADIGSEFSGRLFDLWAYRHGVQIAFSGPGKPADNSFVETFNGSLRDECLNLRRSSQ